MEYRKLGQTELEVSSIGMGCVTFGREIDESTSFEILDHAFERGITLFDTAAVYGQGASETLLGEWMKERNCRDRIVLATKVSMDLSRKNIFSSLEESLKRLQTESVDLLQLHSWDEKTPLEESLEALTELVKQGKVRYVGCSNFSADQVEQALSLSDNQELVRMNSVQPPYNLVNREIEEALLPLCQKKEIGVISYSPLAAGFLTGKYQKGGEIPSGTRFDVIPGHQPLYLTDHGFEVLDQLERLSRESGYSIIQLALGWTLHQKTVTSMLIGARKISHVDQAFEAEKLLESDKLERYLNQL